MRRSVVRLAAVIGCVLLATFAAVALADPPPITISPENPDAGQTVTFSTTADCVTLTCTWSGDVIGTGSSVQDSFTAGSHSVTLTTSDGVNEESSTKDFTVAPPNTDPSVTLQGPDSGATLQTLDFHADAEDSDGSIASYEWYVGAVLQDETSNDFSVSFPKAGSHSVTVVVTDNRGGTDSASRVVDIANREPEVSVTHSPGEPARDQAITFNAVASDQDGSIVLYEWRRGVNGDWQSAGPNGSSFTTSFSTAGTKEVFVRVTDDNGARTVAREEFQVGRPPQVAIDAPIRTALTLTDLTFKAIVSDDGSIESYEWTIDGQPAGGGQQLVVQFPRPGSYEIGLRVEDDDGNETAASPVEVMAENRPPEVNFTWEPATVQKDDEVTFTSRSSDPDGDIVEAKFAWDLNGDGQYDDAFGETATRRFPEAKKYTIGLKVTDSEGDSASLELALVPGNRSPKASITVTPDPPAVNQVVTLASGSTDQDGSIAKTEWDLDGDGDYDDAGESAVHRQFSAAGLHTLGLKVTDDDGATDVTRRDIDVAGAGTPVVPRPRAAAKMMRPFPRIRMAGRLTPNGAFVSLVSVRAPKGARVRFACRNRGCARPRLLARTARQLVFRRLHGNYRAGAVLEFRVTRPKRIGKYTRFVIRKGKAPARVDRCLWPGKQRPRRCPGSG